MHLKAFGESVNARDIERMSGDDGPVRFVRLCGALVRWDLVERGAALADFRISERLNVPDRGVDAECWLATTTAETGGVVGPGRTIFQFKHRDVGDRRAVVRSLAVRLREEVRRLPPDVDRYVLMTNVDVAGADQTRLRSAILAGAPQLSGKPIIVRGAAEIAVALNASPPLRNLFAAAGGLSTVDVIEAELEAAYRELGWAPFVDRARELSAIRDFVDRQAARVLRVQGPRYSGRTRLVLEAVKSSASRALWAVAADEVGVDLLRDLDSSRDHPLLVVDDDDDVATRSVLEWAEQRTRLKTIVITRGESYPSDGSDPLTVNVSRMSTADLENLLQAIRPELSFGARSWIIEGSDGLPGLAIHAAARIIGPNPRQPVGPEEFRRSLGRLLNDEYEARLSPGELQALRIASVLPVIGVAESVVAEVAAVARALKLDPSAFAAHQRALERAGLLRRRGRFVAVVPPLLAEHLAAQALTDPQTSIADLEVALPSRERFLQLLERVVRLPDDGIRRALERVVRDRCGGFERLVSDADVLCRLAPAAAPAVMACIEAGLSGVTTAALATMLAGPPRRAIVETLEELAHRSETFEAAAHQLLALADAENEPWANNARGIFLSLFHWRHPELSASLSQRLAALRRGAISAAAGRRAIVAEATGAAFKLHQVFRSHHPMGPHPPQARYVPKTSEEVVQYGLGVVDLLASLRRDGDEPVRASATASTIQVVRPLVRIAVDASTESGLVVPPLVARVFEALREIGQAVNDAGTFGQIVTELEILQESLDPASASQPTVHAELLRAVTELDADMMRSFRSRVWRVVGPPTWKQRARRHDDREERQRSIQGLATEILEDANYPSLFEAQLDWLLGSEARRGSELFHTLGRRDARRGLWASLAGKGATAPGQERMAAYLAGWADTDRGQAHAEIDRLITSRPDLTRALIGAVAHVFDGEHRVAQVARLFASGGIPSGEFVTVLVSTLPWEEIPAPEMEHLLAAVDDATPTTRGTLLQALAVGLMRGGAPSPRLRELAWTFLEASSGVADVRTGPWWGEVAARLGESEPRRLLALVENVIGNAAADGHGSTLRRHELTLALATLRERDRPGLIQMLLRLASKSEASWSIDAVVEDEVNPVADRDTVLEFARHVGVDGARTVALTLSAEKPGFWELARELLAEWGDDNQVRDRLLSALPGDGLAGSALPMIEERLNRAAALRADPNPWVASWAQEAVAFFEDWRRREARDEQEEWIWDYRIRRSQLEGMVQGSDSPDKRWAIGRLLEHAPRERVIELLTPDEILKALDSLPQLPEHVRERWEAWARHWAGRH